MDVDIFFCAQYTRDILTKMNALLFAILVVISIVIILTVEKTLQCIDSRRERFTAAECGISGVVTLNADPLSRYNFRENKDSPNFAIITRALDYPQNDIAQRHTHLAKKCDETPGCIAFNSSGYLLSGILPEGAIKTVKYSGCPPGAKCGLHVRKCAMGEPLYVEFFPARNYQKTADRGRILVPPGNYADTNTVLGASGVIIDGGAKFNANNIKSVKIPHGLKLVMYWKPGFTNITKTLSVGNYNLNTVEAPEKTVLGIPNSWEDDIASFKVQYA